MVILKTTYGTYFNSISKRLLGKSDKEEKVKKKLPEREIAHG